MSGRGFAKKRMAALGGLIAGFLLPASAAIAAGDGEDTGRPACQWFDENAFKQGRVEINAAFDEGLSAYECGDYRAANRRFEEIVVFLPANPHVNYYLAASYVALGRDRASRRYFQRAISEEPTFIDARLQLALVDLRLKRPERAAEQLDALKRLQAVCAGKDVCGEVQAKLDESVANIEAALTGG